jgi:hypothetical protein
MCSCYRSQQFGCDPYSPLARYRVPTPRVGGGRLFSSQVTNFWLNFCPPRPI